MRLTSLHKINADRSGHTVAEMVVVTAVIAFLSLLTLYNFTGLNDSLALNRSARELALALRRAQNASLAVNQVGAAVPRAVGIQLSTATPTVYFMFADNNPRNWMYNSGDTKIGADTTFDRGVRVQQMITGAGAGQGTVHIIFSSPEASMTFTDASGGAIADSTMNIRLSNASGSMTKTVTVRVSGQITIQ